LATHLHTRTPRERTVKVSPKRALAQVRKAVPGPSRIEEDARRYRRSRQRRLARDIVADEMAGC
jgi:hypothetical protein